MSMHRRTPQLAQVYAILNDTSIPDVDARQQALVLLRNALHSRQHKTRYIRRRNRIIRITGYIRRINKVIRRVVDIIIDNNSTLYPVRDNACETLARYFYEGQ
jgi:hypothetical protein